MRRRRRQSFCLFIRTCALITLLCSFYLFFTANNVSVTYDSPEWDEYFRRAKQVKKPPSQEILEKLTEGMLRLGNRKEEMLYIKIAKNISKNSVRSVQLTPTATMSKAEAIGRFLATKGIHQSSKSHNFQHSNKTLLNGLSDVLKQTTFKRVKENILPKISEMDDSLNALADSANVDKGKYETGANQNRQFLQIAKPNVRVKDVLSGHTKQENLLTKKKKVMSTVKRGRRRNSPNFRRGIETRNNGYHYYEIYRGDLNFTLKSNKSLIFSQTSSREPQQTFKSGLANSNVKSDNRGRYSIKDSPTNMYTFPRNDGADVLEGNIFWSKHIEGHLETGLRDEDVITWSNKTRHQIVAQMRAPDWRACGRPKNQYIVMEDGGRMCARYRSPHLKLVQGEIYSFYLARLLKIWHVPAVVLSMVNSTSHQWMKQKKGIEAADWEEGTIVALIQWITNLERGKLPALLLHGDKAINPTTKQLKYLSLESLVELMQWTDLVIFDYITGNYDRVASNQDAADKEHDPSIMADNIHNLRKNKHTNAIWLIDNESGFIDGYELMRNPAKVKEARRFRDFHSTMLNSICIFRKSTIDELQKLYLHRNPANLLREEVLKHEPLASRLPSFPKLLNFDATMKSRIRDVVRRVEYCKLVHG
ncbi:four-jointed box protein 1-like [Glandiceps talaboti]